MSETWYSKDKFTLYRQLFVLTRKGTSTELEEVVHTLLTLCRSGWLLTPEYFLPSQWIPVLASVYSLPVRSQYLFTLYLNMAPNLSNMRCSIFEISAVQLPFVTEIAPKSPFLCVNRSPIRYGFCVDMKSYLI